MGATLKEAWEAAGAWYTVFVIVMILVKALVMVFTLVIVLVVVKGHKFLLSQQINVKPKENFFVHVFEI